MAKREQLAKYLQQHPTGRDLTIDGRFLQVLRILRKQCSPEHPVRVRRIDPDTSHLTSMHVDGTTWLVNADKPKSARYFLIELNKKVAWNQLMDHIMHEWAHCLTWYVENRHDHGAQWSAAYGRIYRVLIDD